MRTNYYLLIVFLTLSCTNVEMVRNSPEDIKQAEKISAKFYKDLAILDTIKINTYLRNDINSNIFNNDIKKIYSKSGYITQVDINKTETIEEIVNGIYLHTIYKLELTVNYDDNIHIETLGFEKKSDDRILLYSYFSKIKN